MEEISKKVKEIRHKFGLSQEDFGKSLTVSQSYISRIESGKEIPTPMFTKLFCLLYSVGEIFISD